MDRDRKRDRIDKGRRLRRLRDEDEDFKLVLDEIADRMMMLQDSAMSHCEGRQGLGPEYYIYKHQALKDILDWLDFEIEAGQRQLLAIREETSGAAVS